MSLRLPPQRTNTSRLARALTGTARPRTLRGQVVAVGGRKATVSTATGEHVATVPASLVVTPSSTVIVEAVPGRWTIVDVLVVGA